MDAMIYAGIDLYTVVEHGTGSEGHIYVRAVEADGEKEIDGPLPPGMVLRIATRWWVGGSNGSREVSQEEAEQAMRDRMRRRR